MVLTEPGAATFLAAFFLGAVLVFAAVWIQDSQKGGLKVTIAVMRTLLFFGFSSSSSSSLSLSSFTDFLLAVCKSLVSYHSIYPGF